MKPVPDESPPLTARSALETLQTIEHLTDALRRRTSGMTWMIWGFVVPAIFLSYGGLGATGLFDDPSPAVIVLLNVLWIPWVAIGLLATNALWRSVALPMALDRRKARRDSILQGLLFTGAIFAGFPIVQALRIPLVEPGVALLGIGVASVASGLLNLNCDDRSDRYAWVLAGMFVIVTTVVAAAVTPHDPDYLPYAVLGSLAPLVTAIAYVGAGIWLSLRG